MKAILEFDLDDPDDAANHLRCVSSTRLCMAISDFDVWLRDKIKYEDREDLEEVREALNESLYNNAINMDELLR